MPTQGCTLFTASSSQRLRVASGSQMVSAAGQALMWGGWFKFATVASVMQLIAKGNWTAAAANNEYFTLFHNGVPGIQASVSSGAAIQSSGYDNTPSVAAGAWRFVLCWYDPATAKVYIELDNNATIVSAAAAGGILPDTALNFTLGTAQDNSLPFDGRMNSVFAIQRATAPTVLERRWLYNQGYGRIAADLGVAGTNGQFLLPAAGKGDWWDLNDNNANHTGAVNGIVLVAPGGAASPTFDGTDSIARYTGAPGPDTFAFGAATAYFSGYWVSSVLSGQTTLAASGVDSTCEFTVTGSACTINCFVANNGGNEAEFQVDGGAWTPLVPSAYGSWTATAPIYSGLADAPSTHSVAIRGKVAPFFKFAPGAGVGADATAGIINATGTSPDVVPPAGFASSTNYLLGTATNGPVGQVGALNNVRLESGFATATDASQGYTPVPKPANVLLGTDGSESIIPLGPQIRFKATTPRIDLWCKNDTQGYGLIIDGAIPLRRKVTTNDNRWGWNVSFTGLDGATEHTYGLILSEQNTAGVSTGSGEPWAIRTPGGTMNTASQPAARLVLSAFGDSLIGGQQLLSAAQSDWTDQDAMQGYVQRLAEKLGYQSFNSGIGGTTLKDFTASGTGTVPAGVNGVFLCTKWSGEARASHDVAGQTSAAPIVLFQYGKNDVDQQYNQSGTGTPLETSTQFRTSFHNAITTINTGLPSADVYVLSILPSASGYYLAGAGETDRLAFNSAMAAELTSIANAKNHFISLDNWGYGGAPGTPSGVDYTLTTLDNLHPNRNGREIIAQGLINAITAAKTIAVVPVIVYPSTTTTLRLSGFGTAWNTSHALTFSAGTPGTPTVSNDGFLTVSYTAPATEQDVTITDTGSGATGTLHVAVPALVLSPTTAVAGSPVALTFHAELTNWRGATPATLFTAPGVVLTGASVTAMGTATATITPAAAGPLVITDTSTGQTATLTVTAPPGRFRRPSFSGGMQQLTGGCDG